MDLWKRLQSHKLLKESVTPRNFLLYIIVREYSTYFDHHKEETLGCLPLFKDESQKFQFYTFLLNILNNESMNPFKAMDESDEQIPSMLKRVVKTKISSFKRMSEFCSYIDPSSLKTLFRNSAHFGGISLSKKSIFGIFLRKFVHGLQFLTYEQMVDFTERFFECYSKEPVTSKFYTLSEFEWKERLKKEAGNDGFPDLDLEDDEDSDELSHHQVTQFALKAVRQLSQNANLDKPIPEFKRMVQKYRVRYPDIIALHYVSYLLSVHQRNVIDAEHNLHQYFASRTVAEGGIDAECCYIALNSASMSQQFGYLDEALLHKQEALRKALESEDPVALDHVKTLHSVLESQSAPLNYDVSDSNSGNQLKEVRITEFRSEIRKLLNKGEQPKNVFKYIYESNLPLSSDLSPLCTLELALVWCTYGFRCIGLSIVQSSMVSDCLKKCSDSDDSMIYAITHLAKAIAESVDSDRAIKILHDCAFFANSPACKEVLDRTELEIKFDVSLRSGKLDEAGRYMSGIRIFNRLEADLKESLIMKERGDLPDVQIHLQRLIEHLKSSPDSCREHPDSTGPPLMSFQTADYEIRARLILIDVLIDSDCHQQLKEHFSRVEELAGRYHLVHHLKFLQVYRSVHCLIREQFVEGLSLLNQVLPFISTNFERFTVAKVRLIQVKLAMSSVVNSDQPNSMEKLDFDAEKRLKNLFQIFSELGSWRHRVDTAMQLSAFYSFSGNIDRRNYWAHQFSILWDERFVSNY